MDSGRNRANFPRTRHLSQCIAIRNTPCNLLIPCEATATNQKVGSSNLSGRAIGSRSYPPSAPISRVNGTVTLLKTVGTRDWTAFSDGPYVQLFRACCDRGK